MLESKYKELLRYKMSKYQFVYQEFDIIREFHNTPTIFEKPEKIVSPNRETSFPIRMQESRIRKRITVSELACQCGIAIKDIINYESGTEVPSAAISQKIQSILEMT